MEKFALAYLLDSANNNICYIFSKDLKMVCASCRKILTGEYDQCKICGSEYCVPCAKSNGRRCECGGKLKSLHQFGIIGSLFGTPLAIVILIIIGIYVAKHDIKSSNEHATASQTAETTISTDVKKTLIADTPDTVHETNLDQDDKDTQTSSTVSETASSAVAETNDSSNQEKTYETSFNCSKASNFVEKSICTDSSLAQLDIALSDMYKEKLGQADNKAEFKQNQKEWVLNTEGACQDKECIENAINQRISYLKN